MSPRGFRLKISSERVPSTRRCSASILLTSAPGGLKYKCGNGYFALFESAGAPSGEHTQMAWEVDDLHAVMAELRRRGVVFEEYDLPDLKTVNGIAEVAGNYPSSGGAGERGAWFRDSEGNLLAIGQPILGREE